MATQEAPQLTVQHVVASLAQEYYLEHPQAKDTSSGNLLRWGIRHDCVEKHEIELLEIFPAIVVRRDQYL